MQPSAQPAGSSTPILQLADGRKVLPDGRVVREVPIPQPAAQVHTEIQSGRDASRTLQRMHRKLGDLPDIPQKMNPIAAVLLYSCIGLNDADIATALGAQEAQIKQLKSSELYVQLHEMFDRSVFDDAKRNAKHIIAKASDKAANRMVEAIDSDDANIALVASRDVLKFTGLHLEESVKLGGGLKIVIEKKDGTGEDKITVSMGDSNG